MVHATDPRIDAYIDALPDWQQSICHEARDIVHAADPEVTETIKRTRQPYFVLQGNVLRPAGGQGSRQCLPVRRWHRSGPGGIVTGGHDNHRPTSSDHGSQALVCLSKRLARIARGAASVASILRSAVARNSGPTRSSHST